LETVGKERLADWGEFALIDFLARRLPPRSPALKVGIGDDASCWRPPAAAGILTTVDLLVEGVHFDLAYTSAADLGWKALAVNLSDIAAMGGRAHCAFLGLGLPATTARSWLEEFVDAFLELAARYRVELAGGDTVKAGQLVISVTLNGSCETLSGLRSGARAGDDIYVSGAIGDSFLGLELLRGRLTLPPETGGDFLRRRHLRPTPRLELGQALVAAGAVAAMIDVSDGLAADLGHLLTASGGLGAELESSRLPFSAPARAVLASGRVKVAELLTGGEDFELLFTAPPEQAERIAEIAAAVALPVTRIGRITATPGLYLAAPEGTTELSCKGGYDHFQSQDQ
jgi:thiamine-monophosphate kinase